MIEFSYNFVASVISIFDKLVMTTDINQIVFYVSAGTLGLAMTVYNCWLTSQIIKDFCNTA